LRALSALRASTLGSLSALHALGTLSALRTLRTDAGPLRALGTLRALGSGAPGRFKPTARTRNRCDDRDAIRDGRGCTMQLEVHSCIRDEAEAPVIENERVHGFE
jgi:hypothetical protein